MSITDDTSRSSSRRRLDQARTSDAAHHDTADTRVQRSFRSIDIEQYRVNTSSHKHFQGRSGHVARKAQRTSYQVKNAQLGPQHIHRPSKRRVHSGHERATHSAQRLSLVGKRIVMLVALVVMVVVVAVLAAGIAFVASVSGKLSVDDASVSSVLVSSTTGEAYYSLLVADFDEDSTSFSPDALILARVDEESRLVTLISIPVNLRVELSDGNTHQLSDAIALGGAAELIETVASFAGVSISHYVRIDAEGIMSLVEFLGGVTVELVEEVDDPAAGTIYLHAGEQTVSGDGALVLLRATNYTEGIETQAAHHLAFTSAVIEQLLSGDGLRKLLQLDSISDFISTDLSVVGVFEIAQALSGLLASSILVGSVPGYETTLDGVDYFVSYSSSWSSMMTIVEAGEDPSADEEAAAIAAVDLTSFDITVRNGYGTVGAASEIAEALSAAGFQVTGTGNMDSFIYEETLVVYQDDTYETAAAAVVSALGVGRSIASNSFYTFDTDILVIVGNDWLPLS